MKTIINFFTNVVIYFAEFFIHILSDVPSENKEPRIKWHAFHFLIGLAYGIVWCVLIKEFVIPEIQTFYYWLCGVTGTLLFFNIEFQQLPKNPPKENIKDGITDFNQFMALWLPVLYMLSGLWASVIGLGVILTIYVSTYKWGNP
jgi:hypothetical protein